MSMSPQNHIQPLGYPGCSDHINDYTLNAQEHPNYIHF
jgi:hypothetical protein